MKCQHFGGLENDIRANNAHGNQNELPRNDVSIPCCLLGV